MEKAIEIRGLSKSYHIISGAGAYRPVGMRIGESLSNFVRHPLASIQGHIYGSEVFWALKDVNLDVGRGETVGIIGRNGAGKSTLLKILSQITYPTAGEIVLRGSVGSLLEVGTGFHPDLTGRENVFLNGAILGMGKKEIQSKFDAIVKFAEVEKFLDTPIKRYSSGMYLRLAFSVAAHLEPDILIADEVLAVGDQQFQAKCLGKMKEVAGEGRTVIFVSHNMHAVRSLCETGVFLRSGRVVSKGPVDEVINAYSQTLDGETGALPLRGEEIIVDSLEVIQRGLNTGLIDGGLPFEVVVRFTLPVSAENLRMGIVVNTSLGDELVRSLFSDWDRSTERLPPGDYEARLTFPGKLLSSGNYTIALTAHKQGSIDLLQGRHVDRVVNVSAPMDFNSGGPADPYRAEVLLDRKWELQKMR